MLKGASPFGLRECSVVLVDIFASYKRANKSAYVEGILHSFYYIIIWHIF